MQVKFKAGNSGIYLGRGLTRNGVNWVDDCGDWQPEGCLVDAAGMPVAATRGLYFYLGAARVTVSDVCQSIHINACIRSVSLCALGEVLDYLDFFRRGYSVSIEFFWDGWVKENFTSEMEAIHRVERMMRFRSAKPSDSVLMEHFEPPSKPVTSQTIQAGFEAWKKSGGSVEHDAMKYLLPKLMVYQRRDSDGQLMALSRGKEAAYNSVLPEWGDGSKAPGFDYEYPSRYYNERMTEAYGRVFNEGEVCFDHIRATMPQANGEPHWVPYQRLLIPLLLADGSRALGCLSHLSQDNMISFLGSARSSQ